MAGFTSCAAVELPMCPLLDLEACLYDNPPGEEPARTLKMICRKFPQYCYAIQRIAVDLQRLSICASMDEDGRDDGRPPPSAKSTPQKSQEQELFTPWFSEAEIRKMGKGASTYISSGGESPQSEAQGVSSFLSSGAASPQSEAQDESSQLPSEPGFKFRYIPPPRIPKESGYPSSLSSSERGWDTIYSSTESPVESSLGYDTRRSSTGHFESSWLSTDFTPSTTRMDTSTFSSLGFHVLEGVPEEAPEVEPPQPEPPAPPPRRIEQSWGSDSTPRSSGRLGPMVPSTPVAGARYGGDMFDVSPIRHRRPLPPRVPIPPGFKKRKRRTGGNILEIPVRNVGEDSGSGLQEGHTMDYISSSSSGRQFASMWPSTDSRSSLGYDTEHSSISPYEMSWSLTPPTDFEPDMSGEIDEEPEVPAAEPPQRRAPSPPPSSSSGRSSSQGDRTIDIADWANWMLDRLEQDNTLPSCEEVVDELHTVHEVSSNLNSSQC